MKKLFLLCLCLAFLFCGCAEAVTLEETEAATTETTLPETTEPPTEETTAETTEETTEPTTEPQPESFLLTFAGDCTVGAPFDHFGYGGAYILTVGEDYGYPFRGVMEWFGSDDASFVNLEGPLCEDGERAKKKHVFRGPPQFVNVLTEGSVEAVSLANNHVNDFKQAGYDSTRNLLTEAGIPYVEKDSSMVFTTESGLTVGLYAATYEHWDREAILAGVSLLAEDPAVDVVIFAAHWGIENTYHELKDQKELAHAVIDAGADIVWGTHPHVLQPIELYGDGVIFYSLGNFTFGGNAYPNDYDTALVQQEVIREPDGTVHLGTLTVVPCSVSSVSQKNDFQPTPYPADSRGYARVLEKLNLDSTVLKRGNE